MKEVRKRLARYSCLCHYEPTFDGRGNRHPSVIAGMGKGFENGEGIKE